MLTGHRVSPDGTARAGIENPSGSALCEYDRLFGAVRRAAPARRVILTSEVRELDVTRPEGDRAVLLTFVDQTPTRGDQGGSAASGSRRGLQADRRDGRRQITRFGLFDQPLPADGAGSQC